MKTSAYIKAGMFLFAMILLYFANEQYSKSQEMLKNGIKTSATCINLISVADDDGSDTYKSVFVYQDEEGNSRQYTTPFSSNPPAYDVDEVVEIVYLPENHSVKVVSFWGLYRWVVFLLIFALPFLLIGGIWIWKNR